MEGMMEQGAGLPARLYAALTSLAGRMISTLPGLSLFLVTTLLATYLMCACRPELLELVRRHAPKAWQENARQLSASHRPHFSWRRAAGLMRTRHFHAQPAGTQTGRSTGRAPSTGCPGWNVCGISGLRSGGHDLGPASVGPGKAILGLRHPPGTLEPHLKNAPECITHSGAFQRRCQ